VRTGGLESSSAVGVGIGEGSIGSTYPFWLWIEYVDKRWALM
jgi:hypothetical protein